MQNWLYGELGGQRVLRSAQLPFTLKCAGFLKDGEPLRIFSSYPKAGIW